MVNYLKKGGGLLAAVLLMFTATCVYAENSDPMTPQLADKAARVKRQQAERITPEKRKAAGEALKQKKQKLHKARHDAGLPNAPDAENNHHNGGHGGGHGK